MFEWLAVGMDDESVLFQTVNQIKTSNIWAPNYLTKLNTISNNKVAWNIQWL